jgi:hypothetical protein
LFFKNKNLKWNNIEKTMKNIIKKLKEAFTAEVVLALILFEGWILSFTTFLYLNEFKNVSILIFSGGLLVFIASILTPFFGKE